MSDTEMTSRLEFAAFDTKQRSLLASAQSRIESILPRALDRFYANVRNTPQTMRFFKDEKHMGSAKGAQSRHWSRIASGQFDDAYYESVRRIGERHAIIGLEPRWYIGAYSVLLEEMFRGLAGGSRLKRLLPGRSRDVELMIAVMKAALVDMELSVSIYFERTKASQVTVVEALESELGRLSRGDLTAEIDAEFAPEYATVKSNFNKALASLRAIIGSVMSSATQLRTGSSEIAQASEDLARRTESNAANLEETSAAITQIDQRIKATAESADRTVAQADQAIHTVSGGRETVDEAVQAMGRVSESAKGIDSVIEGLDKIAFQTRGLVDRTHGLDNAKHGGDDADRRQPVSHHLQRMLGPQFLVMVTLDIGFHGFGHLVGIFEVYCHHPQIVADELDQMMVSQDARVSAEHRAFLGCVEMGFDRGRPALAKGRQQREQQGEQIAIIAVLPPRRLERPHQALARLLHDGHRIADQKSPERGTANSHHLMRQGMQDDVHLAASQDEAAEDTRKNYNKAYAI